MFETLSKKTVNFLINHDLLDQENKEIYVYSVEFIFLNTTELLTTLLISILFNELLHFIALIIFFIPLRIMSGGFHFKRSEVCFVFTTAFYIFSLFVNHYLFIGFNSVISWIVLILSILCIFIFAPIMNINHPLSEHQIKRNKKIMIVILMIDCVVYFFLSSRKLGIASSEIVFIFSVFLLVLISKFHKNG